MSMTSRERVLAAMNYQRPDRPPLNYYGPPETTAKLLSHLGLETREELLRHFGADMRYVGARYAGPTELSGMWGFSGGGTDIWGVEWKEICNEFCAYNDIVGSPLSAAETLSDLQEHSWPSLDWFDVSELKQDIRQANDPEPRAIILHTGGFLEIAWSIRGFERFLMDLVDRPEMAEFVLARVTGFCKELTVRCIEAADGGIDVIWSASDIGMQTGMLLSPDLWREQIKPFHRELIEPFKKMGFKTRYHTDGAVLPVIEDLIEMGLDMLDPIQPRGPGMDPENLAALFGGRLSFYGGVDTQEMLPYGTPGQIEQEVLRLIRVLGANGGYVVAASNAVQPDVPIENIEALYGTARNYRY